MQKKPVVPAGSNSKSEIEPWRERVAFISLRNLDLDHVFLYSQSGCTSLSGHLGNRGALLALAIVGVSAVMQ